MKLSPELTTLLKLLSQSSFALRNRSLSEERFQGKGKAFHKRAGLRTSRRHNDLQLDEPYSSTPLLFCFVSFAVSKD